MPFQTHVSCGFHRKCFVRQSVLASSADAKLLGFSQSDSSMTLRINGMLRTHITCARGVVVPIVVL